MDNFRIIHSLDPDIGEDHIQDLLNPDLGATVATLNGHVDELIQKLSRLSRNLQFTPARTTATEVEQNFSSFGKFSPRSLWNHLAVRLAEKIEDKFGENVIGWNKLNGKLDFTDLALQYYPPSSADTNYGISPHRDHSGFINLVVVLLIQGPASFFICKDRSGKDARELRASPGDLIIMRGGGFGGSLSDTLPRPYHFIGRIDYSKGRLSFGMRQVTSDPVEATRLRAVFANDKAVSQT